MAPGRAAGGPPEANQIISLQFLSVKNAKNIEEIKVRLAEFGYERAIFAPGPFSFWIGASSTILDGVKIGKGAIIGAGTLVHKRIRPYTINVGVPAQEVKKRG